MQSLKLKITKELNNVKFDHAGHGVKMLFENGMIRDFIEDNQYVEIIKIAINNHSRLTIEVQVMSGGKTILKDITSNRLQIKNIWIFTIKKNKKPQKI